MSEEVVSIFLSYSRKDGEMLSRLNTHLAGLIRTQKIKTWHDRDIEAGSEWEPAIQHQLNTADIVILLISADFIASEYCYGNELQRAIERHNAGEAIVIPVILKPCLWNLREIPFSKLNVLPDDTRPITKWADPDEALATITQHISNIVERLNTQKKEKRQAEEDLPSLLDIDLSTDEGRKQWWEKRQQITQEEAELRQKDVNRAKEAIQRIGNFLDKNPTLIAELASERDIDYTQLEEYLKTQQWREADHETYRLMITAVGKKEGDWLDHAHLKNLPCEDLWLIDQLWVEYSNGKWGFSIQKKIWHECGSPRAYNSSWEKFGDRVGWRKQGKWISYDQLTFDLSRSLPGEFPFGGGFWVDFFGGRGFRFSSLAQRLVDCSTSQS